MLAYHGPMFVCLMTDVEHGIGTQWYKRSQNCAAYGSLASLPVSYLSRARQGPDEPLH